MPEQDLASLTGAQKATSIGPPQPGTRIQPTPTEGPLTTLARWLVGDIRPASVVAQDPFGITGWERGAGQPPLMFGTIEAGGMGMLDALGARFPRLAKALKAYTAPTVGGQIAPPFYSRLDEAVQTLPKQTFGPRIAGIVQKGQASAEELAARKVPQFIEAAGNKPIQRAALEAHLAEHPVPQLDVKVIGGRQAWSPELERAWNNREFGPGEGARPSTPDQWAEASSRLERVGQQWQRNGDTRQADRYFRLAEEANRMAEGIDPATGSTAGQPKFAQYQLPGGEKYRETLITLPDQGEAGFQKLVQQRDAVDAQIKAYHQARGDDRFAPHPPELVKQYNALQDQINAMQEQQFKSSHFDEPNVLVHTRSNERDLPGLGRGTFLEEVQSDWHQQGKAKGYARDTSAELAKLSSEWETARRTMMAGEGPESAAAQARMFDITDRMNALHDLASGVPNAPFKETWPDLALKHHIIEAAQDPKTQWLGFTSGETQAARYDLSKQVKSIDYRRSGPPDKPVFQLGAVDIHGDGVPLGAKDTFTAQELPDVVGKELAQKIIDGQGKPGGGRMTLSGIDLKVGGEGMREFYDRLLPKRLEKIVKPFGGKVESVPIPASDWPTPVTAGDRAAAASRARLGAEEAPTVPGWIVRLTPEMKAKILRIGIPLMTGFGAIQASREQK